MIASKVNPGIKSRYEDLEKKFSNLKIEKMNAEYKVIFDNLHYLKKLIDHLLNNPTTMDELSYNFETYYLIQNLIKALENWYILLSRKPFL